MTEGLDEIFPEMHAVTKMAKIRQNRQIPQADFASTNLIKNLPKSMNIHTV